LTLIEEFLLVYSAMNCDDAGERLAERLPLQPRRKSKVPNREQSGLLTELPAFLDTTLRHLQSFHGDRHLT